MPSVVGPTTTTPRRAGAGEGAVATLRSAKKAVVPPVA